MLCKLYFLCKCIQRCITVCCLHTHNFAGNIIKTRQVICFIIQHTPPPFPCAMDFCKRCLSDILVTMPYVSLSISMVTFQVHTFKTQNQKRSEETVEYKYMNPYSIFHWSLIHISSMLNHFYNISFYNQPTCITPTIK